MNNNVNVKVCGMTRKSDVEQVLSLGAGYIGFIVYPKSPRALALEEAAELSALVPKGRRVVVDVETAPADLRRYQEAGFDYFQIHVDPFSEEQRLIDYSSSVGRDRLWLVPRLVPSEPFPERFFNYAKTIVLDTYSKDQVGGTGHTGDFARCAQLKKQFADVTWILAGGLNAANISNAVKESTAAVVDVNSGVESAPGVKDMRKLKAFFQALSNAEL